METNAHIQAQIVLWESRVAQLRAQSMYATDAEVMDGIGKQMVSLRSRIRVFKQKLTALTPVGA